jgi:hypothetical protein
MHKIKNICKYNNINYQYYANIINNNIIKMTYNEKKNIINKIYNEHTMNKMLLKFEIKNIKKDINVGSDINDIIKYVNNNIRKYNILFDDIFEQDIWNIYTNKNKLRKKYFLSENEIIFDNSILYNKYNNAKKIITLFVNNLNKQNNKNIKFYYNFIDDHENKIYWTIIYCVNVTLL